MQLVGDAHETAWGSATGEPAGNGTGWMVQLVPSQCSASGALPLTTPTAVQLVADRHDTARKLVFPAVGLGLGWMDQPVPPQCSASVSRPPPTVLSE